MKNKSDLVIKIIIVILIAVFLGLSFLSIHSTNKKTLEMANRGTGQGGANPNMVPQGANSKQDAKALANTISVSVKTMEPETIQSTIKVTGDISSTSQINIYPDTSGKITKILKNIGETVSKGEVIAYVDPSKPGSAFAVSPVTATISGSLIDLPVNIGETVNNRFFN